MFNVSDLKECDVLNIVARQAGIKPKSAQRHRAQGYQSKNIAGATTDNDYWYFKQGEYWTGGAGGLSIAQPLYFGNFSFQVLGLRNPQTAPYTFTMLSVMLDTNDGSVYNGTTTETTIYSFANANNPVDIPQINEIQRYPYFNTGIQVLTPYIHTVITTQAASAIQYVIKAWFEGWEVFTS